jgi:antitoxin component YwqK of YwqJK toxin-antitoxin module
MNNEKIFLKNIELWSKTDPKKALLLSQYSRPELELCRTGPLAELNLKNTKEAKDLFFYSKKGALKEAKTWFAGLNLSKSHVLFVYGVGLGYYHQAVKAWLKEDKIRRCIFLEDDLGVICRFFETEMATDLLQDPQTELLYFKDLQEKETVFEVLYWNFAMTTVTVSALNFYAQEKKEIYDQLQHKIAYDFAVKNALIDEYLRFGGSFFINFYQNMLSLPGSYQGNKTFGSFRKVPAIICGAGPSLEKNLPLLSTLTDKALIFAGGSALNALNAFGMQPHLGAGIDPNPAQYVRLSSNEAFEVPFYYRNRMYHEAFEMIHGPRLYITGCGGYDIAEYFEERLKIGHGFLDEGHNVVNFCLQIAQQLGCDPIIFVGLDLAFTGMKSYAPGVEENIDFDPSKFGALGEFDEKPLLLKDIYDQPLYTLWKWVAESEWIGDFAKEHKDTKILNATEGGLGFKGIVNIPLVEAAELYLTKNFAIRDRLNGEIQNSTMPQVTSRRVESLMKKLKESLIRSIGYFDVLIEETEAAKKNLKSGYALSGKAALCETELAEELGFQHVIEIFNEVQVRLCNRILHEIKDWPAKKKNLEKLKINIKRLSFLRDVAKVNVGMIDLAFEKRKKAQRKKLPSPDEKPLTSLPECPFQGFVPLLLPEKPSEGQLGPKGHRVITRRQYGKAPEEVSLELNGELDGQCLLYYPNGKLKMEVFYQQGQLHGPSTYYSKSGQILSKSWFKQGKQVGESKWYYASGSLYGIQRYENGLWDGKQEYYYEDGKPKTELWYKKGKLIKKALTWYPEGQLKNSREF